MNQFTINDGFQKAARYCAYQERCHNEVRHKLAEWGLYGEHAETVLVKLIEQNFLNEERFARAFAGGKFRVKQWGRHKIRRELKVRGISEYCIQEGLKEIEEADYNKTLKGLLKDKLKSLKSENFLLSRQKCYHYAATKGYESEAIWKAFEDLELGESAEG